MIDYEKFFSHYSNTILQDYFPDFKIKIDSAFKHGDVPKWESVLNQLPDIKPSLIDLNQGTIKIGEVHDCDGEERDLLRNKLMNFHPWRKGPYNLFGIKINTEWRSDFKWDRLKDSISPLKERLVLDVGCGNGYHCLRMLGAGAESVIGIDPYILSIFQFNSIKHFTDDLPVWILPLKMEAFPQETKLFDTVFSMGVFYHRRSPFEHLSELRSSLRSGGELVFETLVIDGTLGEVLVPEKRYAKMRNVWFIPSTLTLESWLKKSGFRSIRLIDVTKTSPAEQRSTEWMTYESLTDFLDPTNIDLTIEGYPAPQRAIFIAEID